MAELWQTLAESRLVRILWIVAVAVFVHLFIRLLRRVTQWYLSPAETPGRRTEASFVRQFPKFATVTSLLVSAVTFVAYFVALVLILRQLDVDLTPVLATAGVLGLAIGFGSQSLVQDSVVGLTLLFSDAFNVGDVVEISGQIGRVDRVGLRFTKLINFHGQEIYVPNRNIALVSRFRRGSIRAYADVQLPGGATPDAVKAVVEEIARGMRSQYSAIILSEPRFFDWQIAEHGKWHYMRVRFHLWPGQGPLIETVFKNRVVASLREIDPTYADWMISITYRMV
jgi:moderate conductance mechanosensitive channel